MTLVLLMAIDHLAAIADALQAAGLGADTPAAAISDGWTRRQRVVTAPLRDLAAAVSRAGVANPAVIVIGDVAELAPGPEYPAAGPAPGQPGNGPAPAAPVTGGTAGSTTHAATSPAPRAAAVPATPLPRRILVLGGARSGKSQTAEGMLTGYSTVDYVATGTPPGAGDEEWDGRVREHQYRRPAHWRTVETLALADVLAQAADGEPGSAGPQPPAPVLVDCLTTWLARVMDECAAWDGDAGAGRAVTARIDGLLGAWRDTPRHVVAVSNEIGSGVVPETSSGRRFRDELGRLNARVAAASDEVWLCTAGIARRLR
jgi:adenosylcobinamide kinase/adenosylcobinamide-phosphate guanylyltransferase